MLDLSELKVKYSIYSYKQCAEEPKIEILSRDAYDMKLEELNAIINHSDVLKATVEKYYLQSAKYYGTIFEPMYNRAYLSARYRGWLPSIINRKRVLAATNFIECEAHRDKLSWWLEHFK